MQDPLKSPGNMLTQRKFMPKDGSLTGHELHTEAG